MLDCCLVSSVEHRGASKDRLITESYHNAWTQQIPNLETLTPSGPGERPFEPSTRRGHSDQGPKGGFRGELERENESCRGLGPQAALVAGI